MTVRDIIEQIELQGDYTIVQYDEKLNKRIILDIEANLDKRIEYMYCENNVIYFEVEE